MPEDKKKKGNDFLKKLNLFWLSISTTYSNCNYLACFRPMAVYNSRFHILYKANETSHLAIAYTGSCSFAPSFYFP